MIDAKQGWVAFIVKENELPNPIKIGLFRAVAVVAGAQLVSHLFKQSGHGEAPKR